MDDARSFGDAPGHIVLGRGGMAAAALTLAALTLSLTHVLVQSGARPDFSEIADPVAVARLPRVRPDEPRVTGSIRIPSTTKPRQARAEPARAQPSKPDTAASDDLRSRAFLVASSSAECDHVVDAEVLQGGGPDALVVVGVRCNNGARFYLDHDSLYSERNTPAFEPSEPIKTPATALTSAEAIRVCEDKLRGGLAVPPSLSRVATSTGVAGISGGDAVVSFDFDALNGLGFPLFMHARCEIRARQIARLDVQAR